MAKRERAKTTVRILDRKKIAKAKEIRVVVKGGKSFTLRISRPLLDGKGKFILQDVDGAVVMVTSISRLAQDIERFFKAQGLEPLYVYPVPATQLTLLSE